MAAGMSTAATVRQGQRFALGLACVLGLVALVYVPTLNDYFGGDDFLVIGPVRALGGWELVWKSFVMQDNIVYWRPLVSPLYALEVHGFGLRPWAYHLVVLGLHLVNVALVALIALALTGRRGVALAAGLVFGIYPAHTTTVAQISSTVELFSVVWYLLSVLCAMWYLRSAPRVEEGGRRRGVYWLSLAAFALALLSKESTASAAGVLTVLFVLAALAGDGERRRDGAPSHWQLRRVARDLLPFWALVIPYIVFTYLMGTDDPDGVVRYMYAPGLHALQNLWWFLARLAAPLEGGYGPHVSAAGHAGAALLAVAGIVLLVRGPWQARFLVLWTLIALTPLAPWRPELLLGRFTYQASAPFAILLAWGGAWMAAQVTRRWPFAGRPVVGAALLFTAILCASLTITQNGDRAREGEDYRLLVSTLQREYPRLPAGSVVELVDGPWPGPFHALYLNAVADTLYGAGTVRIVNVAAGPAMSETAPAHIRLRYRDGTLARAD